MLSNSKNMGDYSLIKMLKRKGFRIRIKMEIEFHSYRDISRNHQLFLHHLSDFDADNSAILLNTVQVLLEANRN